MVKFDKDGKFMKQVIKMKVKHEENHDRLYDKVKSNVMEKWLKKYLEKEISKTEMYFIISLENKFKIERVKASVILEALMNKKIDELNRFVKCNQGYTLSYYDNSYIISTPKLFFRVDSQKEDILNFMNEQLKEV